MQKKGQIVLKHNLAKCGRCGTHLPIGTKVTWYPGGKVYGDNYCCKRPKRDRLIAAVMAIVRR